ncbi:DNA translocase FtsK [Parabacteroides sp. 52]|uniref:FtsK/SpoIIIE family DNA translocase n=1 Tax=unclassified Parabacteroides TaxID=2649774 RepID=UPI0013D38E72|nr:MULTISPECIES: DNA translocase FtsK [unclassified Parabacteroides]MDH6533724.1 S-DNA-T family DNA segregation ATPase FtsK/SpoIIIE [Parabacteroides sp. PM5-20]NDV54476.1 DNA translocase FtsK [Parabacteroides sp. 52]
MAKKKNTVHTKNADKSEKKTGAIKAFLTHERTRYITGLIICLFTIYVGLALISFFFTGGADQSKIENVPVSDLVSNRGSVSNWTGVRGAYLANLLMNKLFGVSSFVFLFFLGSLGAKLMRLNKVSLLRRFLFCAATMVLGSVFFGFVFVKGYEDTFLYLGGEHGYYWSEILINNIGVPGTILVLAGTFLIIAILTSKHTIPFLQKFFAFGWLKKRKKEIVAEEEMEGQSVDVRTREEETALFMPEKTDESEGEIAEFEVYDSEEEHFEVTVPDEEEEYISSDAEEKEEMEENPAFTIEVPVGDDEQFDGSSQGDYDPKLDLSSFRNPSLDLLKKYDSGDHEVDMEEQTANQRRIKQTLENFGISIASIKATVGPTITLYEVIPDAGVRIAKIRNLEDDIALSLSALGIRIIAPMPGKGTIGIEVPNKDPQIVSMQSIIASRKFQESKADLPVALGKTITNEIFMFDLCKMPHLLVAGATGQGKSVGLNAIITSLLYKKHPSELKFVLVDPKMVEFSIYSEIERHYLAKLPDAEKAIITDFTKVIQTLNSLCKEMDDRYDLLMKAHTRNIKEYNAKFISRRLNPEKGHRFMPYIVVIIDEFGDLIMTAGKEIELPIARIAQKARAVGIHMVIATQRPSTNIITGTIKANFPARMAFRVSSMIDSRTILDSPGANQLIGRGDLLFSQGSDMVRVQCAFVDTPEVEQISEYIGQQVGYPTAHLLPEYIGEGDGDKLGNVDLTDRDPLFDEAARLIVIQQQGSTSLIQRKFAIGYNRAGRLMDQLEAAGIVGPFEGSKARQVLIQDEYSLEQLLNSLK